MPIGAPLTDEDFEGIKTQIATLDELDGELKKARNAGLDVAAQMAESRSQRDQLNKIRQAYFPNRQ